MGPARAIDEMGLVPLGNVAKIDVAEGTNQISRGNGKRRIVVQCNVRGRDLGSFVEEAQSKMVSVHAASRPVACLGRQFENLVAAQRLTVVVPICFFLIFLLLFSTFKSVKYAVGLQRGAAGPDRRHRRALAARHAVLHLGSRRGFIALSGVAVLNGLVMVSFINQLRREGLGRDAAILRAVSCAEAGAHDGDGGVAGLRADGRRTAPVPRCRNHWQQSSSAA